MPRYLSKLDIFSITVGGWKPTSVKHDHPGPTGKLCKGREVRFSRSQLGDYNRDRPVQGFCLGCGWNDLVTRR